ncbi:MAG: dTMP kinase [Candidatus Cloacimonadaceae bacterium]|jgi:dTMP kinase|nr:dTMP kinase [Candidatus Cloacimonadota bacterium]MDY0127552.1 dTMP kinase [Candidatus Cloacimonadaceae bacterium]MCB5254605.1 dTMP kinase [Candidatus Cloacimonadota bacterium]MCK9178256.1 dTMP kinase [Candidatus Cloacimonadota bacterium]MCK9242518.1 dTMP kinase [Candidatus Cloacimonadota bacterium]
MPGYFITFEGIEGSGKSTQIKLLEGYLAQEQIPFLSTREPGGTPVAEAIRKILLDPLYAELLPETELLLYSASRAQHTGELILPALNAGKVVISDRYYDSTYAYQGAARDLDYELIDVLSSFATFHTVPDLTVLLDLPAQEGLGRIVHRDLDRLEQEDISFHRKVREQFLFIAKKHASRYLVLDATKAPEVIHQSIIRALNFNRRPKHEA